MDITKYSLDKLVEGLAKKEFSSVELLEQYKKNIDLQNGALNAILEVFERAKDSAQKADELRMKGDHRELLGIPYVTKDNICIKGEIISAGSRMLIRHRSVYDASVVKFLNEAGAFSFARSNMDEFAMGSSTEYSAFGPTRNPLNQKSVAGGSSGGSASAVASNMCAFALGSDTGGSIRQPASFCGIVGLYPTYGAVSRNGLIAMASSLDQVGPCARSVADAEYIHNILSRHDPRDARSVPLSERKREKRKGRSIGVPRNFIENDGVSVEVKANFEASLKRLEKLGYTIVDISIPLIEMSLPVYYILQTAEASTNLARYDGMRYGTRVEGSNLLETYKLSRGEGFGPEVQRRILLGTYVLSAGFFDSYYKKADTVRKMITRSLLDVFETVDVIATPTTPTVAFPLGSVQDPVAMYVADLFTVPANIAGIPALSVPSGLNSEGLAYGLHFMAPHFCEDALFSVGKDFEQTV